MFSRSSCPPETGEAALRLSQRVNFVNEYDTRRLFLRLRKQVTHPRGAYTYKHLNKARPAHGKERHFCLAGNGFSEQGFSGARRADQQDPLGIFPPSLWYFFRSFEIINNLLKLFLGLRLHLPRRRRSRRFPCQRKGLHGFSR